MRSTKGTVLNLWCHTFARVARHRRINGHGWVWSYDGEGKPLYVSFLVECSR